MGSGHPGGMASPVYGNRHDLEAGSNRLGTLDHVRVCGFVFSAGNGSEQQMTAAIYVANHSAGRR